MGFGYGESSSYGAQTGYGDGGDGLQVRIAQAWFELAQAGGEDTAVRIARASCKIPDPANAARIARAWLDIPSFAQRARIAQAWFRAPSKAQAPGGGEGTGGPTAEDPSTPGGIDPTTGEEVVVTFERVLKLVHCFAPSSPRGKQSWSHYGTGQFRSTVSAGMQWEETYEPVRYNDPRWWDFHAYLTDLAQNERVFLIDMPERIELGAIAGTPVVSGADQVGYSIVTSGWTGTMKRGDVIKIDGINYVFTVMAEVSGPSAILVNPAIREGGSPADGAAIQYGTNVLVRAKIDEVTDQPGSGPGGVYVGLKVSFREVP